MSKRWLRSRPIYLNEYGSKIWELSRCRPTVSKMQIVLLGFWLILFPWMFISSCTTIYFFVKIYYISVNAIYECSYLFFFWLRNRPSIKNLRSWGTEGVMQNVYRCTHGERGITPHVYRGKERWWESVVW